MLRDTVRGSGRAGRAHGAELDVGRSASGDDRSAIRAIARRAGGADGDGGLAAVLGEAGGRACRGGGSRCGRRRRTVHRMGVVPHGDGRTGQTAAADDGRWNDRGLAVRWRDRCHGRDTVKTRARRGEVSRACVVLLVEEVLLGWSESTRR